ncbi:MAG TPA: type IV pilus assembly protein PilM [Patescibacteria group bacterium]|nr:type IV pilus assembly protein PilM [Patescibacteria group bacterium]
MANINSFGLDIGTKLLKVVMLHKDGIKLSFKSCLTAPMPANGMASESSFDLEEIAQTIRKLVNDANIGTNNVHAALPDRSVYTKVVEVPQLEKKDLASAIYWEAEQNIPSPLSTITLSWRPLRKRETPTDSLMDVLLVGAPTTLIRKYKYVLEMAGLNLISLETEVLSVVRALGFNESSPSTLVVNVSGYSTSLVIIQKGLIVYTYSIPLGDIAINRAICTELGFSDEQAEEYKRTYGLVDQQIGGKIAKAIQPILMSIVAEIKKSLAFYTEKYATELDIKQLVLAGDICTLPGIDLFFVQTLGMETIISDPWKMCNIHNVTQQVLKTKTDYAVAVGLALKDYEQQ